MSVQEILQLIQKKKRLSHESFVLKLHGRIIVSIMCMIFALLFVRERAYGVVNCTPPDYINQNEFNSFCASGHVFQRTRNDDYLKTQPFKKSPDFG